MNSTLPIIRDEDIDKVFQKFIANDSYNVIQNNYVWIGVRARPLNELSPWHWITGKPSGLRYSLFRLRLRSSSNVDFSMPTALYCNNK